MRTRLLIGVVIGVIVGALIGGLVFAAVGTDTTATAFLRLRNPADLTAIAGGASQTTPDSQDNTSTFVAGEIAYLSGEGFAQAVARKMAQDEPAELSVVQSGESAVVTISNSSASDADAIRTVQVAIDLYRQQLEQRVDEQLRTVLPALTEWERHEPPDSPRAQELRRVRESVELQGTQASTLLVVQPPTPNHRSPAQLAIGAFLGALIGGAMVAAILLARRRRSGRGALVRTMTDSVDGVLLPAVDLRLPPRADWTDDQARLARTLYAQCPAAGPHRLILVIGATASSGAAVVAELLEFAAAENQSGSAEPAHVVYGAVVGDPTLTSEVINAATHVVAVTRLESDTAAEALALRSVTAASPAPVLAVFTYRRRPEGKSTAVPTASTMPDVLTPTVATTSDA